MFEVLVFLVDNYFDGESCPDPEMLELKLKAAGFDGEEIGDALEWLAGLEASGRSTSATAPHCSQWKWPCSLRFGQ